MIKRVARVAPVANRALAWTGRRARAAQRQRAGEGRAGGRIIHPHQFVLDSLGDIREVVLILGAPAVDVAAAFANSLPGARVHLLSTFKEEVTALPPNVTQTCCVSILERSTYLAQVDRPQLILEHGNNRKGQKLACFRELFPFLRAGGIYVIEELKAVHDESLEDYPGEHVLQLLTRLVDLRLRLPGVLDDERAEDCELAAAIEKVTFGDNAAYVTKRFNHLVKLRDQAANDVLTHRYAARWGKVVETAPSYSWAPIGRAHRHGKGPHHDRARITVPARYLRAYEEVLCQPRQRLSLGNHYLPDTFRHPLQARLNHRELVDASAWLARDEQPSAEPRRLEGSYFFLDSEYPGHFGHVLTEVLGRYWGWRSAFELDPTVRPLISLDPGQNAIPEYQRLIFEAVGIPTHRIEYVRPGTCVRVERMYAATPGFAQPQYADRALGEVWERIGSRLALPSDTPARIFVSRRNADVRSCTNTTEVEAFFADKGFAIIYPEEHGFRQQVTMFRNASAIAGFGGSGMFSTMFSPGVLKLVLAGDAYTANNEFLIAAVNGGDIHYFSGESEQKHPKGRWTWDAFLSNFHVTIDKDLERAVDRVLTGC